jgi:hypothetical protein
MRLLVLGGTGFLGRATVEAALAAGHEVTLLNRGRTNSELFPEAERLRADLAGDLDVLAGHSWDAVIDLDPTQLPRHSRRRAELLSSLVRHYVFVSSISVYADPSQPPDESSPVHDPPEPEPDEFVLEQYSGLTLGEALERVSAAVGGGARLVWIDERRILDAGVEPWMELPLWAPGDGFAGFMRADVTRAVGAGLTFRPLEQTALDTLRWSIEAGEQRPTLSREKERELLATSSSAANG